MFLGLLKPQESIPKNLRVHLLREKNLKHAVYVL
jgi:hypothetical protein